MCRKEGVTAINPVLMVNTTGWMHRREGVVSWDMRMVETFKICHTFWERGVVTSLLCHGWLSTVPFSWCMMLLRVFHKLPSCLVPFSVVQWGCGWIQWPRMLCILPPCLVQWNKFSGPECSVCFLPASPFLTGSVRLWVTSVVQTALYTSSLPSPN